MTQNWSFLPPINKIGTSSNPLGILTPQMTGINARDSYIHQLPKFPTSMRWSSRKRFRRPSSRKTKRRQPERKRITARLLARTNKCSKVPINATTLKWNLMDVMSHRLRWVLPLIRALKLTNEFWLKQAPRSNEALYLWPPCPNIGEIKLYYNF